MKLSSHAVSLCVSSTATTHFIALAMHVHALNGWRCTRTSGGFVWSERLDFLLPKVTNVTIDLDWLIAGRGQLVPVPFGENYHPR